MHIDLRFFIAELLVLWVPLSIVVLVSELLKFNWLLTGLLLLLVLLISVILSVKLFDDSAVGIIVFMLISTLAGSVVIDAK